MGRSQLLGVREAIETFCRTGELNRDDLIALARQTLTHRPIDAVLLAKAVEEANTVIGITVLFRLLAWMCRELTVKNGEQDLAAAYLERMAVVAASGNRDDPYWSEPHPSLPGNSICLPYVKAGAYLAGCVRSRVPGAEETLKLSWRLGEFGAIYGGDEDGYIRRREDKLLQIILDVLEVRRVGSSVP